MMEQRIVDIDDEEVMNAFFDPIRARARQDVIREYIRSLLPPGANDIRMNEDELIRAFGLDVHIKAMLRDYPQRFAGIGQVLEEIRTKK